MPGALGHTAYYRAERENMSWTGNIGWGCRRVGQYPDGTGTVGGANTGADPHTRVT